MYKVNDMSPIKYANEGLNLMQISDNKNSNKFIITGHGMVDKSPRYSPVRSHSQPRFVATNQSATYSRSSSILNTPVKTSPKDHMLTERQYTPSGSAKILHTD
jgi:hypothetical protein